MNAVKTRNRWKQLILCFSVLLFLFSFITPGSLAQDTQVCISKPRGLNNWTPSFLLPRGFDNQDTPGPGLDSVIRTDFIIFMRDGVVIDAASLVNHVQNPGSYSVTFNASHLSNGVYFYKLATSSFKM